MAHLHEIDDAQVATGSAAGHACARNNQDRHIPPYPSCNAELPARRGMRPAIWIHWIYRLSTKRPAAQCDAMRNFFNSHWKVILAILLAIVLAMFTMDTSSSVNIASTMASRIRRWRRACRRTPRRWPRFHRAPRMTHDMARCAMWKPPCDVMAIPLVSGKAATRRIQAVASR